MTQLEWKIYRHLTMMGLSQDGSSEVAATLAALAKDPRPATVSEADSVASEIRRLLAVRDVDLLRLAFRNETTRNFREQLLEEIRGEAARLRKLFRMVDEQAKQTMAVISAILRALGQSRGQTRTGL